RVRHGRLESPCRPRGVADRQPPCERRTARDPHAETGHAARIKKNRGITVAASAQLGMPHHAPLQGLRMTGKLVGTVEPPMQHLAVIKGRKEFTLVRWRPGLLKMGDKKSDISVRDRTIAMVPRVDAFGTSGYRDKELSPYGHALCICRVGCAQV